MQEFLFSFERYGGRGFREPKYKATCRWGTV